MIAPWFGGPANKRDRARFAALPAADREAASALAASKYDGTRTVARCWAEALDEITHSEQRPDKATV
jgi:hypothetical protein